VMGADTEISFLFADVRRSSELARALQTLELAHVMQRFYRIASDVLLEHSAILDKFIGDEAVGFFLPFMTGRNHAGAAVRAARELLRRVGEMDGDTSIQLGIGVNTGTTFVGMVSSGSGHEFTAFGDAINVASHLAAAAGPGEILTTAATIRAAGIAPKDIERRTLSLKGHDVDAMVLPTVTSAIA